MARTWFGTYMAIGDVSFNATPVGPGITGMKHWFKVQPGFHDLSFEKQVLELDTFFEYDVSFGDLFEGVETSQGTLTVVPNWSRLNMILRHVTGHSPTPTGTGPYLYTFTPKDWGDPAHYVFGTNAVANNPAGPRAFGVEMFTNPTSGQSVFYDKIIVNTFELSFKPKSFLELKLGVIGGTVTAGTKSTPVYTVDPIVTPTGQASVFLNLGGATFPCYELTLRIENGMTHEHEVTSFAPTAMVPAERRKVSFEATIEVDTDDFVLSKLKTFKANSFGTSVITFDNGLNPLSNPLARAMSFTFDRVVVTSPADIKPEKSNGKRRLNLKARCVPDQGGAPYIAALVSGDSSFPVYS